MTFVELARTTQDRFARKYHPALLIRTLPMVRFILARQVHLQARSVHPSVHCARWVSSPSEQGPPSVRHVSRLWLLVPPCATVRPARALQVRLEANLLAFMRFNRLFVISTIFFVCCCCREVLHWNRLRTSTGRLLHPVWLNGLLCLSARLLRGFRWSDELLAQCNRHIRPVAHHDISVVL